MEGSSQIPESVTVDQLDLLEDYYPMTKKILGNVYIFNQVTFDNSSLGPRYASIRDSSDIEKVFNKLKFNVKIYNDLSYKEILEKLSKIAKMDYSNFDCLVIFVLTHGKNGKIFAKDIDYYPDVFWKSFNDSLSFMYKPKLIFIQDSRGDEIDGETRIRLRMQQTGQFDALAPTGYTIPDVPDVLLMYSSYDRFFSWRNRITGSSFVQHICRRLKVRAKFDDVVTCLTFVNRILSMNADRTGHKGSNETRYTTIVSTLTRVLHFGPINK